MLFICMGQLHSPNLVHFFFLYFCFHSREFVSLEHFVPFYFQLKVLFLVLKKLLVYSQRGPFSFLFSHKNFTYLAWRLYTNLLSCLVFLFSREHFFCLLCHHILYNVFSSWLIGMPNCGYCATFCWCKAGIWCLLHLSRCEPCNSVCSSKWPGP